MASLHMAKTATCAAGSRGPCGREGGRGDPTEDEAVIKKKKAVGYSPSVAGREQVEGDVYTAATAVDQEFHYGSGGEGKGFLLPFLC